MVQAWAKVKGPVFAERLLAEQPPQSLASYQPYWALRATLLSGLGRWEEAVRAFDKAMGLCVDPATRDHLLKQALSTRARIAGGDTLATAVSDRR